MRILYTFLVSPVRVLRSSQPYVNQFKFCVVVFDAHSVQRAAQVGPTQVTSYTELAKRLQGLPNWSDKLQR